jgi:hypothetical protein
MPKPPLFVLTNELQRVLENLPDDEPRSRLEPFRAFILRWRRDGRSYRSIQEILASWCGVRVTHETVRRFVKLRARPRKAQPESEVQPETRSQNTTPSSAEIARQRALIQDLRSKPVVVRELRKRFVYDPDEPLILEKHKQES